VQFAKSLRSKLSPSECEILLFNSENHMVFHPLADVARASINGDAAATPLWRSSIEALLIAMRVTQVAKVASSRNLARLVRTRWNER
jgi:hypothetical protein